MKKETKVMLGLVIEGIVVCVFLAVACFVKRQGDESGFVFLAACSLFLALWAHAGIICKVLDKRFDRLEEILENKKNLPEDREKPENPEEIKPNPCP